MLDDGENICLTSTATTYIYTECGARASDRLDRLDREDREDREIVRGLSF